MGGSVFAHEPNPLDTPRMPPSVFHAMSQRCKEKLRHLFLCVACPIEAPGKTNFGDIDIFVAWPTSPSQADMPELEHNRDTIQKSLGAQHVKTNGNIAHYAVPWPEDLAGNPKTHIQVDVTVTKSPEEMQWLLFKHAHGDLWSLLGSIIRPYGLTVDDQSLSIRIPEVEKENRKLARVPLTTEPAEVLRFLGLPDETFWEEPFPSIDAMFEYAAQCRMFRVRAAKEEEDDDIKSDDRRRMKTRPVYNLWLTSYVPRCRLEQRFLEARTSREAVKEEVLERFHVREVYQSRLDQHISGQQILQIKRDLKEMFPVPENASPMDLQYRGCLVKALARIVLDDDETYGVAPDPASPLRNARGVFDVNKVRHFIETNHQRVGAAAMARNNQAYRAKQAAVVAT